MASFTLSTTGKILWGTVHAKDISVTFSAGTKGGTIVRGNILSGIHAMQHPTFHTQDGQTMPNMNHKRHPKTSNNRTTIGLLMSATKHLNRQVRHRIWCRAWCIWMHGFHSPAGCIPSAAELKPLACREMDSLSEGRSTSHKSPSRNASCSLHPHLLRSNSPIDRLFSLVSILGHWN